MMRYIIITLISQKTEIWQNKHWYAYCEIISCLLIYPVTRRVNSNSVTHKARETFFFSPDKLKVDLHVKRPVTVQSLIFLSVKSEGFSLSK